MTSPNNEWDLEREEENELELLASYLVRTIPIETMLGITIEVYFYSLFLMKRHDEKAYNAVKEQVGYKEGGQPPLLPYSTYMIKKVGMMLAIILQSCDGTHKDNPDLPDKDFFKDLGLS